MEYTTHAVFTTVLADPRHLLRCAWPTGAGSKRQAASRPIKGSLPKKPPFRDALDPEAHPCGVLKTLLKFIKALAASMLLKQPAQAEHNFGEEGV